MTIKFEFVNNGEFGNPFYVISYDSKKIGEISYYDSQSMWYGVLLEKFGCSADVFEEIANKLDELNESLEQQRKEYLGLI